MTVSAPSSEKRFCPTYLVCRNASNASAALSFDRMYFCSATGTFSCGFSMRSCSHARLAGSRMCMYSTPMVRQYESRSRPRTSRSFMQPLPANPSTGNSRSRSHSVSPCEAMSRSGCLRCGWLNGSVSAMRWPRVRYASISSMIRAVRSICDDGRSWRQRIGS
ncbi:MAG: hypothetical protein K0S40_57 [Actinomycetospora sp.]|nr:hypothetical protein [Actinomycetospora sp.]